MSRWTRYLLQALGSLADDAAMYYPQHQPQPPFAVDLDDDLSVRQAFRSIVEWGWGPAAFDRRPD